MRRLLPICLAVVVLGGSPDRTAAQSKDPVKDTIPLLKDDNTEVRRGAAYTLKFLEGHEAAIPDLILALKDQDAIVRDYAIEALVLMYPRDVVPPLAKALKDAHPTIRRKAAEALGRVRNFTEAALPDLILLLKDGNPEVRRSAAKALKNIQGGP
jgi:HEAT repeat protein